MLELSGKQRAVLADKLADTANVAAGALVFGQFLGGELIAPLRLLIGAGFWVTFIVCAVVLTEGKQS